MQYSPDPDALLVHTPNYGSCDASHREPNVEYVLRQLGELHDATYDLAGDLLAAREAITGAIESLTASADADRPKPLAMHRRGDKYLCDACALAFDRTVAAWSEVAA